MDARIVGLDQSVSFEDGSVTNFLLLRLSTGHIVRAIITDESADLLVQVAQGGSPPASAPVPRPAPPSLKGQSYELPGASGGKGEEESHVFGGDVDDTDDGPWMPPAQEDIAVPSRPVVHQDAEAQARAYREAQKAQKERMKRGPSQIRTVPKDEFGYPKLSGPGVDPSDILAQGGRSLTADEDGVGSI